MNKDIVLAELEITRGKMLDMVNNRFDGLITRIENGEPLDDDSPDAEMVYPLSITPALFKGTKPSALFFGDEMISVKTWFDV